MDPTANLLEQIKIAHQISLCEDRMTGLDCRRCQAHGARLAELVLALDGWLRGGGFTPTRWITPERPR